MTIQEIQTAVRSLTRAQRAALDNICDGNDSGMNHNIGLILKAKGLVRIYMEKLPGFPPVSIYRYTLSDDLSAALAPFMEGETNAT